MLKNVKISIELLFFLCDLNAYAENNRIKENYGGFREYYWTELNPLFKH